MKLFLDTALIEDVDAALATGLVEGLTTNPSLMAKSGQPMMAQVAALAARVPGPVSAEVGALNTEGMIAEGKALAAIARNVVVKLPLTEAGLQACQALRYADIKTNVTLCFSAAQALCAAKARATYVSPFLGRVDDNGGDGLQMLREIRTIFDRMDTSTQILAASVRTVDHVVGAAVAGADCVTLPPNIFHALYQHPLTDKGLAAFTADWEKAGLSIL